MSKISKGRLRFLAGKAVDIREHIVNMSADANASHSGSALSAVDVITALYFEIMKIDPLRPLWPERDRFILSKGHGGASLYATLAERGYFPKAKLKTFCKDEGFLTTHPVIQNVPGVEATTGSLGHGLSIGLGMALAGKFDKKDYHVFVMLSDGECDEGSVWEAAMYAGFHGVHNLAAIVDYNKIQSFGRTEEVMNLEPFADKWKSFGWEVREIDGHDFGEILGALSAVPFKKGKPSCIIAHTIKGKGVSYMENKLEWHYRSPTGDLRGQALKELQAQRI